MFLWQVTYAEFILLNEILQSAVILSVTMLGVIKLDVILLGFIWPTVVARKKLLARDDNFKLLIIFFLVVK